MDCIKCGKEIHPMRAKVLPNIKTCIDCSTTNKLIGVPIAIGKGEEIYTDLNIMTQESYKEYSKLQRGTFLGGDDHG